MRLFWLSLQKLTSASCEGPPKTNKRWQTGHRRISGPFQTEKRRVCGESQIEEGIGEEFFLKRLGQDTVVMGTTPFESQASPPELVCQRSHGIGQGGGPNTSGVPYKKGAEE